MADIFSLVITDAGEAAMLAAGGVLGLDLTEIAFGSSGYETRDAGGIATTAALSATALGNELARIPISNGGNLGNNQVILVGTLLGGTPEFSVREFGVFTADGTLWAIASKPTGAYFERATQDTAVQFLFGWTQTGDINVVTNGDAITTLLTTNIGELQAALQNVIEGAGLIFANGDQTQLAAAVAFKTHTHTKAEAGLANVDNTSDANKPVSSATQTALNLKANITYVDTSVANLVATAPGTLDTLNELAAALGDDPNFATTVTTSIATKSPIGHGHTKGEVGLANVDNTSDAAKPVSNATQTALNLKANITYVDASVANLVATAPGTLDTLNELAAALGDDPSFATTVTASIAGKSALDHGHSKAEAGLGNVDNTSDANKPVSSATQTALNAKSGTGHNHALDSLSNVTVTANIAGEILKWSGAAWVNQTLAEAGIASAGDLAGITASLGSYATTAYVDTSVAALVATAPGTLDTLNELAAALGDDPNFATTVTTSIAEKSPLGHVHSKAEAGLGNVDNTSDLSKPVSTATQTALNGKSNNGHAHTKGEVGLANVDNTSDANKPVSAATQTALNLKANITYVDASVANLVATAPGTLDTLNELAAALGDDPNFATTITTSIAGKSALGHTHTKAEAGLVNVDNTSDANKPVSSATQTALDTKVDFNRVIATAALTAEPEQIIVVDTSVSAITITAPVSPATNTSFYVGDAGTNAKINKITVDFGAETYNGITSEVFVIDVNEFGTWFLFNGTTWSSYG